MYNPKSVVNKITDSGIKSTNTFSIKLSPTKILAIIILQKIEGIVIK